MAANEGNLTHDEIWDDSALVNSWNDALEEYKKYHSIHVKGGNVDDLINDAKQTSDAKGEPESPSQQVDAGAVKKSPEQDVGVGIANGTQDIRLSHTPGPGAAAPVPAGLLGTVRDEGLKRLLMSWYYAGYYTGYYEGQRSERPQNEESGQK